MLDQWLADLTALIVPAIDLLALVTIVVGTIQAFLNGLRKMLSRPASQHRMRAVWMQYSRWLVAGLTFQLGADIIETSVTPGWEDIGRIGAIAAIRTFLNFFLERDQQELRDLERETT